MRREGPSSQISLPSVPSSDSTACMPGCRHDRAPSRGQSRKPVRPSGMTKPSHGGLFCGLRPTGHSGTLPAWRKASRTAPKHPPFLVRAGANLAESPAGHRPSLPEHPQAGASRTACQTRWPSAPSGQRSPRNGQATGQLPCFLPAPPTLPSLPVSPKRPSSARIASRPWPPALSKRMPDGIRLFIAGRSLPVFPELFQRPGSKREKKTPPLFTPQHPPSSPAVWHALFQTAARQRRGLSPRPEESFFGDGESTRGEGAVFTKKAPSPLVIPPLHSLSTTKKAGQSPAPAFTGKTKERGCVTSFRRYA